jgi:hypothetical protein
MSPKSRIFGTPDVLDVLGDRRAVHEDQVPDVPRDAGARAWQLRRVEVAHRRRRWQRQSRDHRATWTVSHLAQLELAQ